MATNKIIVRTQEEVMNDYTPEYSPLYSLFLPKSQAYPEEVGEVTFRRATALGDIRAKNITPKDTEIKQIAVGDTSKSFKKYFKAVQYTQSNFQSTEGNESVVSQVIDEHQKQFDEMFLTGEGTAANNVLNNGLFYSADANYLLESSAVVAAGTAADHLKDMHAKIMATVAKANVLDGPKVLLIYGAVAIAKYDSLYATSDNAFKKVLGEALEGDDWSVVKIPAEITPASVNGWIAVNMNQIKLHYVALPSLKDQGVNAEKMYTWHNFVMGSMMVEVLKKNGIIRQPVTFA